MTRQACSHRNRNGISPFVRKIANELPKQFLRSIRDEFQFISGVNGLLAHLTQDADSFDVACVAV